VGGLTTAEIASAFLVPEATMAQRISRAKQLVQSSGVPFEPPAARERAQRLGAVLHVLYLIFNEGYASSSGPGCSASSSPRGDPPDRALHGLVPDDAEVAGLLALMLLTDARRRARTGPEGELIPLPSRTARCGIGRDRRGRGAGQRGARARRGGPRTSCRPRSRRCTTRPPRAELTDWPQILALYGLLERMSGNPMVALNRAIAAAMVHGPAAGLELLKTLETDGRLAENHRLDAVRAHLLELAGDRPAAIACYRAAAGRTQSLPERNYLTTRAARLASG
jgi:predicted RNA polymerase sigma factor